MRANEFRARLASLINEFNVDTMLNMPDFVIAELTTNFYEILNRAQDETSLIKESERY